MNNKRGLSNIVATVLIVLLALAAVAIVWGFLKPAFDKTGTQAGLKSSCFLIEVSPVTCKVVGNVATLTYKVVSDDDSFKNVVGVFEDTTGKTSTNMTGAKVSPLSTSTVTLNNVTAGMGAFKQARVAVVVGDGSGNTEVCTESANIVCA
jgi:hypothetical protein